MTMLDRNPNVAHHLIVSLIRTIHLMILKHPQNGMQHASEALLACQCLVWVVLACFKFWLAVESKTRKTSCALKTCSFFCYPFSEFCFLTLAFSTIILFHKFIHAFDTLNIPGIPLAPQILSIFLSLCNFHMNWTYKTHDLSLTLAKVHFLYWKLGGKQIN